MKNITILAVEVGAVDGVLGEVLVEAVERAVMLKPLPLEILASSLPWGPSELWSFWMPFSCVFLLSKFSDPFAIFFIRIMDNYVCLDGKLNMYPCSSLNILICLLIL